VVSVDSSVWIEFFRGRNQTVVDELRRLLDADQVAIPVPVQLELVSGATRSEGPRLRRLLSALPLLLPSPTIWKMLGGWIERAQRGGQRFGAMDLLIAGIAHEHGSSVWSRDADFTRLAALGLVQLHSF
jgi:predicted nucleic acid-binding protein